MPDLHPGPHPAPLAGDASALSPLAALSSSVGRVRKTNEDAAYFSEENGLFIVSDGMGAMRGGELAARLVTSLLPKIVGPLLADRTTAHRRELRAGLQQRILELSQGMYQQSLENAMAEGLGATVVLACLLDGWIHIAHMGDSRAYLFRKGRLEQLTQDHSVVALLLRTGEITSKEAKDHPGRGQLTRYMGMRDQVFGDIRSVRARPGDRLLLCTDGISGMLSKREMARILKTSITPAEAAQVLTAAADAAGGKDNSTALVVDLRNVKPNQAQFS